jgi:hypothetical protein
MFSSVCAPYRIVPHAVASPSPSSGHRLTFLTIEPPVTDMATAHKLTAALIDDLKRIPVPQRHNDALTGFCYRNGGGLTPEQSQQAVDCVQRVTDGQHKASISHLNVTC